MNTRSKEVKQTRQRTKLREKKHFITTSRNTLTKPPSSNTYKKTKKLKSLKLKCNQLQKTSKTKTVAVSNNNDDISSKLKSFITNRSTEERENVNKQKIENIDRGNDKCSGFYLRSSIMQKYGKMTYNSMVPMTNSNTLFLDDEMQKNEKNTKSKKDSFEVYSSTNYCNKNFEFFEMQHSNIIQRIDSSSSCVDKSPTFCDEISTYKECNLDVTHNSLCNRTKNGKEKFARHTSELPFSSEKSIELNLKNSFESLESDDKIIKNKNLSRFADDKQLKEITKDSSLPLFLTGTDHVQYPSEAETAPQTPQGEIFLSGVVSKIQRKFGEEKGIVSCHWVSPDDFHVKAYSLVKQNISENCECNSINCENINYSVENETKSENIQIHSVNDNNNSSSTVSKTKKHGGRKSEIALLHESLKEISWAKDLNPACMLTKERKHRNVKLQNCLLEKSNKNSKFPKKQISKQSNQIMKLSHSYKEELNNLSLNKYSNTKKQFGSDKMISDCKYSPSQNKSFKLNILNHRQYIKKCPKKLQKEITVNQLATKSKNKSIKSNLCSVNKNESKALKNNNDKNFVKNSNETQTIPNIRNSKQRKKFSENFKGSSIQTKPKSLKSQSDLKSSAVDQCPELRVSLEPLEETCLWEAKRKQSRTPSEAYKLLKLKDEQKYHNLKTTWNVLSSQQVFSSSITHNIFSSFYTNEESRHSLPTLRTSKRRRYEEETVRYSVRQSECAFRYKEIAVKKHQNFIQIILVPNRSRHNSLTAEGMKEMKEALLSACKDTGCRAVLFNSSGSIFCSGIDLVPLLGSGKKQVAEEVANAVKDLIQTMGVFPKPLVAAVNGGAVGLGVTLLTFCDVVLASDKATFFMPYAKLGYIAEGAATLTLPQVIGATMATDLLLRGRKLTAQQALRCGLVSEVLWPTQLMEEAIPRMHALAKQSLSVMEATKSMIRCHLWEKLQTTLENESRSLPKQWMSASCQQAIKQAIESGILIE
ncbi:uncharacterized protein LOC111621355 isoform X1 [Centruroides sculpturatus]|uniref:uncharacterized protein LOC111621355 isoform X1 n=1 Tax=Centruroides sculpturatus TaxID=218467 RepID=UPI000C6D0026|nr:uncharacterized protein LOC111621355 isoform X1 [Centruroides sculpturatus]